MNWHVHIQALVDLDSR